MKKKPSALMRRLKYFSPIDRYNDNHTQETYEDREWENVYRKRWQHDKVIRSTHGVNCTGSCSWNIYVKDGIVTWEGEKCGCYSRNEKAGHKYLHSCPALDLRSRNGTRK